MADVHATQLAQVAKAQVFSMTGLSNGQVTGFDRTGDRWVVTVEVVELERVPSTMDVMGIFDVTLSDDGELMGLRRKGRHRRAETEQGNL
jgi:hypothetical protein